MLTGNYKSKSKSKGSFYQKSSAQGQAIPRGSERKIADEYGFKRFGSPTKAKPKGRENLKSISKNLRDIDSTNLKIKQNDNTGNGPQTARRSVSRNKVSKASSMKNLANMNELLKQASHYIRNQGKKLKKNQQAENYPMKCSIETHPTHTDIAAMTALLNSREISIADNIQLSDFDNLEELSLKLVDYIFSKRIFRDQEFNQIYDQLRAKFKAKEKIIRELLSDIIAALEA